MEKLITILKTVGYVVIVLIPFFIVLELLRTLHIPSYLKYIIVIAFVIVIIRVLMNLKYFIKK